MAHWLVAQLWTYSDGLREPFTLGLDEGARVAWHVDEPVLDRVSSSPLLHWWSSRTRPVRCVSRPPEQPLRHQRCTTVPLRHLSTLHWTRAPTVYVTFVASTGPGPGALHVKHASHASQNTSNMQACKSFIISALSRFFPIKQKLLGSFSPSCHALCDVPSAFSCGRGICIRMFRQRGRR